MTAKNLNKPGACAKPTAVKTFLKETFVEESDSLKEGAAGAGLTDND